mgnify:CR=1 FL=1
MKLEIENLIKKIMANNIKVKMLEKEQSGLIINKEIVLEILNELCPKEDPKELTEFCEHGLLENEFCQVCDKTFNQQKDVETNNSSLSHPL